MNKPFTLNSKKSVQDIVQSVRSKYAPTAPHASAHEPTQLPQMPHNSQLATHTPQTDAQHAYPGQTGKKDNVIDFNPRKSLIAQRAGRGASL